MSLLPWSPLRSIATAYSYAALVALLLITPIALVFFSMMCQACTILVNKWRYRSIPGPKPHWLMGNIPDFIRFQGTNIAMPAWKQQHGSVFKVFILTRVFVAITDPEDARVVLNKLVNHPKVAPAAVQLLRSEHRRLDDAGLLQARDSTWSALRRAWQPTFAPGPLVAYAQLMDKCSLQLCDVLQQAIKGMNSSLASLVDADGYIDVYDLLAKMTLEVVGSCAYGVSFNEFDMMMGSSSSSEPNDTSSCKGGQQPPQQHQQHQQKQSLMQAVKYMFKASSLQHTSRWTFPVVAMPVLAPVIAVVARMFPDQRLSKTLQSRDTVINASQGLINDWRAGKQLEATNGSSNHGSTDQSTTRQIQPGSFLSLLLDAQKRLAAGAHGASPNGAVEMDDFTISAQILTFFLGGTETTANTLAFAVYLLCLHPEAEQKLREEVDKHGLDIPITSEDKFPYVDAVVNESLRLYPPAPLTTREVDKPGGIQLGGYHIPQNTNITVSISALHRDPAVWAKPDDFIPERFLPQGEAELGPKNPHSFIPFGAGPRKCIGYKFAYQEARMAIVRLYQRFTFELAPGQVPIKTFTALTLSPQNGVRVRVIKRQR